MCKNVYKRKSIKVTFGTKLFMQLGFVQGKKKTVVLNLNSPFQQSRFSNNPVVFDLETWA